MARFQNPFSSRQIALAFAPGSRFRTLTLLCLWGLAFLCLFWVLRRAGSFPHAIDLRIATDSSIRLIDYIQTGLWWGAFLNLWACLFLIFTRDWWLVRFENIGNLLPKPKLDMDRRWFWGILCVIFLLAAVFWAPRISLSLYNDEAYSLRSYWSGHGAWTEDGEPAFDHVTWAEILWHNREGNNHILYSIGARLSLDAWRWWVDAPEGAFSEAALRTPAFLAGLGSLVAVALLLKSLGWGRAGLLAAAFLVLHPWHFRYVTEARGYALALLLVPLILWLAVRALRSGQARWWIAFGAAQFALLYGYVGAFYAPLLLNVGILGWFLWKYWQGTTYPVWNQAGRWMAANLMGAMVFIQLMAPAIPQIISVSREERRQGALTWEWFTDFWSSMGTGVTWVHYDPGNPLYHSVTSLQEVWPWLPWMVAGLFPLLCLMGLIRLCGNGSFGILIAVPTALTIPMSLMHSSAVLHIWYLVFMVPLVFALVALAFDWPVSRILKGWSRDAGSWLVALTVLGVYGWLMSPQLQVVRAHSKESLREVVSTIRGPSEWYPVYQQDPVVFAFLTNISIYDPSLVWSFDVEDLVAVMEETHREERDLYVTFAGRPLLEARFPELLELVEESGQFQQVAVLHGLEEAQFTHYIYRRIRTETP